MDELIFTMAPSASNSANSSANDPTRNGDIKPPEVIVPTVQAAADPPPISSDAPIVPPPPVPAPAATPEETYEDWTQAGKLGLSLKTLDLFQGLEITKDDDVDTLLTKVNTLYTSQLQSAREEIKTSFDGVAKYIDLVQSNADDEFIRSLAPLRAIADLPLAVAEDTTDAEVLANARELVMYHFNDLLKDEDMAKHNVGLLETNNTLLAKALEIQNQYKAQHDSMIDQKIAQDKAELDAATARDLAAKQKVTDTVKKIFTDGKLFEVPLDPSEVTAMNEALYGKPTEVVVVKEQGPDGKIVEKQYMIRKAEKAFQEFSENPAMQLWFLRQYIRGDFSDMAIPKKKEQIINTALKNALNARQDITPANEPARASTFVGSI